MLLNRLIFIQNDNSEMVVENRIFHQMFTFIYFCGNYKFCLDVYYYLFTCFLLHRFAGNKSTLREVSHLFNVSESTAFIICQRVMDFLTSIGKDIIKFSSTEEEKVAVSAEFEMVRFLITLKNIPYLFLFSNIL